MSRKYWKVAELAKELGLAQITIRTWLQRGRLEYVKLGRAVRIPARSVEELLRRGMVRRNAASKDTKVNRR
jgi:excisionase family DNA binding protein